jgi:hypothetical protein
MTYEQLILPTVQISDEAQIAASASISRTRTQTTQRLPRHLFDCVPVSAHVAVKLWPDGASRDVQGLYEAKQFEQCLACGSEEGVRLPTLN